MLFAERGDLSRPFAHRSFVFQTRLPDQLNTLNKIPFESLIVFIQPVLICGVKSVITSKDRARKRFCPTEYIKDSPISSSRIFSVASNPDSSSDLFRLCRSSLLDRRSFCSFWRRSFQRRASFSLAVSAMFCCSTRARSSLVLSNADL